MTVETTQAPSRSHTARRLIVLMLILIGAMLVAWSAGWLKPRPRVALVTASQGPYWDLIIRGAQDAAVRNNVRLTVITARGDEQSQTLALRNLIGKGYSGVAVSPNDPPRQAAVLAEVANDCDNLVTYDSDSNVSRRVVFVGTNNYRAGEMAAEQIQEVLPDGGEVILCIGSLEKENGQRRRQGVIDKLLGRKSEPNRPMDAVEAPLKAPESKYTIITTLVDGIDPAKATQMASDALSKHPQVKCFAGLFAYSAPSILKALEQAGKLGKVHVVGFDAYEETLNGIEAGNVHATIIQDAYRIGFESVEALAHAARGENEALPLFQHNYIDCDPVTKANLESVRQELSQIEAGDPAGGVARAPIMQTYACGFLFSPDRQRVLLIRKRRPAWQAGKLNGLGGKIEPGETPAQAMRREFREEAGLDIAGWQEILTLSGPDDANTGIPWRGHFFGAFGPIDGARAVTDEQIELHDVRRLPSDTIPNLHWMIPLMLDEEPVGGAYAVDIVSGLHPAPPGG